MKKKFLLILLMLNVAVFSTIFDNSGESVRSNGMGGGLVSFYDAGAEGIFYNPATMISTLNWDLYLSYKNPFSLNFIANNYLAASYNLKKGRGVIGLGYAGFVVGWKNETLLSEQVIMLSYANSFYSSRDATFNAGVTIKYMSLSFIEYGYAANLGIDIGILSKIGRKTYLGFSLRDLNSPSFGKVYKENIPAKMNFGVSYEPYYGVITGIEVEKNELENARILTGVQFDIVSSFSLRFGVNTEPSTLTTGFSFKYFPIRLDYALEYHNILGMTHNFGFMISY